MALVITDVLQESTSSTDKTSSRQKRKVELPFRKKKKTKEISENVCGKCGFFS